jgi:predicted outer membrane repeat protein
MPDPAQLDRMDAHGTLCAGVAAAKGNNGIGVAGIAWNCRIMPIRIDSAQGSSTSADRATAIRWAATHGADILSNSWGWGPTAIIISAVADVTRPGGIGRDGKGCLVCFAAGNDGGPITQGSSASWPEVISVGATDHNDVRWPYSNYGPQLDLVAPSGCDGEWCGGVFATLWTTDLTGPVGNSVFNDDPDLLDYAQYCGGTSFSTPMVAGVAALVLSVNPDLTNLEVGRILLGSAHDLGKPGWDEYYGFGRVDAYAAVRTAFDPPRGELFVDDDAPNDPGPGDPMVSDPHEDGSVEHPFDAIQKAIDASRLPGQIVTVLSGTYTGRGNRDINYGKRIITVRSSAGPESCIIDCESAGRAFFFQGQEGANSAVQGLTITRGRDDEGGAIYCSSGSSPTITGCVFLDNVACIDGGAIHCGGRLAAQGVIFDSKPGIRNCTFIRNSAGQNGGAIYCAAISKPIVHDCVFRENSAGNKGGGTYTCEDSGMILKGSRFEHNAASLSGGAMSNVGGDCTVTSCLFAHNTASAGAGLCCDRGRCFLTSCTVADNTSAFMVGGIWVMSGTVTVKNSIFWGNTPSQIIGPVDVSFSNIQGGWPRTAPGNLAIDPLFADPGNGDYHLQSPAGRWDSARATWVRDQSTSPCIDAGDPSSPVGEETEPNGGRINMGAYGGTAEASKSP